MKKIVAAIFALLPLLLAAQTTETLDPQAGLRLSATVDKKITRGLHLKLEEEVRLDDNFTSLERLQTTALLRYKVNRYFKVGAGYSLINGYSSKNEAFKNPRHRLLLDATGTYRHGSWEISLRERLQFTHRTGDFNPYQNPSTAITLKSRAMLKYRGLQKWQPYASIESRLYLNAPVISATFDGTSYYTFDGQTTGDPGWFISSWNGVYNNRIRLSLGTDYALSRHNSLTLALLFDINNDKEVDANSTGTKLKSYVSQHSLVGWLTIGYQYSF